MRHWLAIALLAFGIGSSGADAQSSSSSSSEPSIEPPQQNVPPRVDFARAPAFLSDWATRYGDAFFANQPPDDPQAVQMLNELSDLISSSNAILVFRNWTDDDGVVERLLFWATSDFTPSRKPASTILANVVDNTNVCLVLERLLTRDSSLPPMDPNGRYNLLLVVRQVSNYAFADVGSWIKRASDRLLFQLSSDGSASQSRQLLIQIENILENRKSDSRQLRDLGGGADKVRSCMQRLTKAAPGVFLN